MGLFKKISILVLAALSLAACSGSSSSSSSSSNNAQTWINTATPPDTSPVACPAADPPPAAKSCSASQFTITGTLTFERVPHGAGTNYALDYGNQAPHPARGISMEILNNSTSAVLDTAVSDASGNYTFCVDNTVSSVRLRARAEMKKTGYPSYDMKVVDNTSSGALYVATTATSTAVSSSKTINMSIDSGWDGTGTQTGTRAAAPFAILDSSYDAMQKVLAACPGATFPPLKFNWSVNNVATSGTENPTIGQISSSYFNGTDIYVLGMADNDTDEYDDHVITHEWGHYFEAFFSRSDSIGGPHSLGDKLDIRVAMSEGWGNAWSGIATDDPLYKDSNGPGQASGFYLDLDNNACSVKGWYSECSVQAIIYDLYDTGGIDLGDNVHLGFGPIFDVLSNQQRGSEALTSLFSFIKPLKDNTGQVSAINTLVGNQNIDAITDIYGDSQLSNDPGVTTSLLPVYTAISSGQTVNLCSTTVGGQQYNGVGVNRFLRFSLSGTSNITVSAVRSSGDTGTDPDILLYNKGWNKARAESYASDSETMNVNNLAPGQYVLDVYNFDYTDTGSGTTCYNITMNVN